MKKIAFVFLFFLTFSRIACAELVGFSVYKIGEEYCIWTHPAENWILGGLKSENPSMKRSQTCELQHILPQNGDENSKQVKLLAEKMAARNERREAEEPSGVALDGIHIDNIVWFPQSYHVRTDTWGDRPWIKKAPFWVDAGFNEDSSINLYQAYMLGTWGITYSVFKYDYDRANPTAVRSHFIPTTFDGVSSILYGYSWLVNIPQKFVNQFAYIISPKSSESSQRKFGYLLGDLVVQLLVTSVEAVLAMICTVVGAILGTILHPISTFAAIPGGVVDAIDTTIAAVWNLFLGCWHVVESCWGQVWRLIAGS